MDAFDGNGQVAGGYITDLRDKGLIDIDVAENEVWVDPEAYAAYC